MSATTVAAPDGTRLAFTDRGTGPVVVLTHGWVVGHEMWDRVVGTLTEAGLRCIAVDRRGCGGSDRPPGGYDFDTLADDLAAVLEALDLRDASLVAHSLGGAEALRMLTRHGAGRVGRLALVATTTPGAPPPQQPDPAAVAATLAPLRADPAAYMEAGAPAFFGDEVAEDLRRWAIGLALRASVEAGAGMLEALATTDLTADARSCPVPALVLHGAADASAPLELTGGPTAELIPRARLEVYPGAPHGLPLTHADRMAADVLAFVGAA